MARNGLFRAGTLSRIGDECWALWQLGRAGGLSPMPLCHLRQIVRAMRDYGPIGSAVRMAAIRHRDRVALIDDRGSLKFAEIDARSNALANAWRSRGLGSGDGVGIVVRNHRGFLDALFAAAKSGVRIVLLNTDFGAAQLTEVIRREGVDLLVHDAEFTDAVAGASVRLGCMTAWSDTPVADSVEAVIADGDPSPPPRPVSEPRLVILTSGTTGTPKGARLSEPHSLMPAGGLLSKAPFRARETTECCVPLSHALGFGHLMLALLFGSTLVVRRRFDPQRTIASLSQHHATAMIAVPIMVRRMIDLGPSALAGRDLAALRIVFVAGSQLGARLCTEAMRFFGPVIYNMYGSTEVAYATIATPEDLAAEPNCVGTIVPGAVVKVFDEHGRVVPTGSRGRIFVANGIQFEGYTGGGAKEVIDGLVATGDIGHFDVVGRLFVDGRADDMIVSGGENVFPGEVEEALTGHPDILDAAVIGVSDDEYGQRLRSFITVRPGASLTEGDVKDFVRQRLARFKVPRDVRFVDAVPRNPTGKVVRRLLDATS
jgi:acyl-CoA synthetase (AMP-forming)/AMP-acid ligase II